MPTIDATDSAAARVDLVHQLLVSHRKRMPATLKTSQCLGGEPAWLRILSSEGDVHKVQFRVGF